MNAQEIMTQDVVTVDRREPLHRAMSLLAELDVRHLPVLDGEKLVGMLSDRDLREAGLFDALVDVESEGARSLRDAPIADAMHTDLVSIDPETALPDMIDLMVEQKVGALPVVDEHTGRLVGIVSYVDVLRTAAGVLAD